MYCQDDARCTALLTPEPSTNSHSLEGLLAEPEPGSQCSKTGLETARDWSSPWPRRQQQQLPPLPYPCCHGGIGVVVLGVVSLCSRLGAGGGVADQSTAPR